MRSSPPRMNPNGVFSPAPTAPTLPTARRVSAPPPPPRRPKRRGAERRFPWQHAAPPARDERAVRHRTLPAVVGGGGKCHEPPASRGEPVLGAAEGEAREMGRRRAPRANLRRLVARRPRSLERRRSRAREVQLAGAAPLTAVPRSSFASGGSAAPSSGVIESSRASGVSAWPSSLGLATRLGHPSIPGRPRSTAPP